MQGIDIGLFEFDRHNALYYFAMNADEEIYLRYGGRDSRSATSYLNLKSLEVALQKGLDLHQNASLRASRDRPPKKFPRENELLKKRTIDRNACVECHLIADFKTVQLEIEGKLDRLQEMYLSPDIRTLGIELDVPKGLVVKEASGAVQEGGMKAGDEIISLNKQAVFTFGDLQHELNKVDRLAKSIEIGVQDGNEQRHLTIALPELWWLTDLEYRHWSVEPIMHFRTEALTDEERKELSLPEQSFASKVSYVDPFREVASPELKVGDIIVAVDNEQTDAIANTVELFIKLKKVAGSKVEVKVRRGDEEFTSTIETERQSFRK